MGLNFGYFDPHSKVFRSVREGKHIPLQPPQVVIPVPLPEPKSIYITDNGYVMVRSSNGNPEAIYHLTPREFYCVSKGLEIYE